jgi:hypothetical protein
MLLDVDPTVVGISSQPLWLFWDTDGGRRRLPAPRTSSPAGPMAVRWGWTAGLRRGSSRATLGLRLNRLERL